MRQLLLNRQKQNFSPQMRDQLTQRSMTVGVVVQISVFGALQIIVLRKYHASLPVGCEYCCAKLKAQG